MGLRPRDVGVGAPDIDQDCRRIEVIYAAHGVVTVRNSFELMALIGPDVMRPAHAVYVDTGPAFGYSQ
ncbi:hypothetical protein GCM10010869_09700 [Mesorhizobium tianshanense]|nr:hypothetical protein GCM10010869_09700 [Mesorhizobium tianshanense]